MCVNVFTNKNLNPKNTTKNNLYFDNPLKILNIQFYQMTPIINILLICFIIVVINRTIKLNIRYKESSQTVSNVEVEDLSYFDQRKLYNYVLYL